MKTTFMFPLLGLFVEKQMRRFRITVRLYKSELSAGKVVKEGDEAGVIAQTEVAPFLIAP